MKVATKLNYLRIAPRKVRLVADLIRGKTAAEAKTILDFSLKRGAKPLKKLLDSAQANAQHNFQLDPKTLQISEVKVNEGPKLKRWRARARGRAAEIQKKASHIILVLEGEKTEKVKTIQGEKKLKKPKKPHEVKERTITDEKLRAKTEGVKKPEKEILLPKQSKKGNWRKIFRRKSF